MFLELPDELWLGGGVSEPGQVIDAGALVYAPVPAGDDVNFLSEGPAALSGELGDLLHFRPAVIRAVQHDQTVASRIEIPELVEIIQKRTDALIVKDHNVKAQHRNFPPLRSIGFAGNEKIIDQLNINPHRVIVNVRFSDHAGSRRIRILSEDDVVKCDHASRTKQR
jgi:hypothetical protein